MTRILPVAVLFFLPLGLAAGDAAKDADKLQGQWSIILLQEGDEKEPADMIKDLVVVVKDDKFTIHKKDKVVLELSFKLDQDKKPKTVDFTILAGEDKGKTDVGIYVIERDTVKFCVNERIAKRPTEFAAKLDGQPLNLVTMQRKKVKEKE